MNTDKNLTPCSWCHGDPLYIEYHDTEWGVPLRDDQKMFEFLVLESFQAGLSWWTILKKRENFREAFDNFDAQKIAQYDEDKILKLLNDEGIVRHRAKIEATINNAQRYLEMKERGKGLSDYFWSFVDDTPIINNRTSLSEVPAKTELSDFIAKDLKKKGFKFLGSTTVYAHLQAAGLVNDHLTTCPQFQNTNS